MEQLVVEEKITDILQHIVYRISNNSDQVTHSGLFNGKMGMAVFLYHYGRCYNSTDCTQVADGFIEEIRNNIMEITSVDYSNGLSGIDAGFQYLLKKGFISTDMAHLPDMVEQAMYKSLTGIRCDNIPEQLDTLSGLGKYVAQDHRKRSLATIGPFSRLNRQSVAYIINLLNSLNEKLIPQLDHKDVFHVIDMLSRIYNSWIGENDVRQLISIGLQWLNAILFGDRDGKPLTAAGNLFCFALALLQIYERTNKPDCATLAIRLLEEYEEAMNNVYLMKDGRDAGLLQHVIACKKLHVVLREDNFSDYAREYLDFYMERKSNSRYTLQYIERDDLSLQNGYAGEGMALLTLEGRVTMDWLEELIGYY